MKLIVGLGNPGQKYQDTLHNLGFMVVDKLATTNKATWKKFSNISEIYQLPQQGILLKPLTYMNESGRAVREIVDYYKIELPNLLVVHDDLDLSVGDLRMNFDSTSAGHRGVQSIIEALSSKAWWRCRLGIGRPLVGMSTEDFVLTRPSALTLDTLNKTITETVDLLNLALRESIAAAQLKIKENKNSPK